MSDLILRRDARGQFILYRHRTNQGVVMTPPEIYMLYACLTEERQQLSCDNIWTDPRALEIGVAGYASIPTEFHRRILVPANKNSRKGLTIGAIQPDLFDVRKPECC